MKQWWIYIFNLIIIWLFFIQNILAQPELRDQGNSREELDHMGEPATNEQTVKTGNLEQDPGLDTLQTSFFKRIEVKFDYLKLVSLALKTENKAETGLGIIFGPGLGINFEMGYGEKMPETHFENADYKVSGYYGRIGINYHYLYNPGTNFFIGAKYGMSQYQDEATYTVESTLWNDYNGEIKRTDLSGQWAEVVAGTESRYKGAFYFGFMIRFRALIDHDNFSPLEVFAIPGYGRTIDKTLPALNLYVKYMLNFDKNK